MALYKNTKVITGGEIRSVILTGGRLTYRPVLKAIRVKEWATYQECQIFDLVIEKRPDSPITVLKITDIREQEISTETLSMDDPMALRALEKIDSHLKFWFTDKEAPRTLPIGYGWDGRTRYENQKLYEFNQLFRGQLDPKFLDEILSHAMLSPRHNVPTNWSTAVPPTVPVIVLPPDDAVVYHFVIHWINNEPILNIYHLSEIKHLGARIDLSKYENTERFLIGSVVRNFHGHNVRWKLFQGSNKK